MNAAERGGREPDGLPEMLAECDPGRPRGRVGDLAASEAERRAGAAFMARLCGCILGKPVEGCADPAAMREAGLATGEWPLCGYISGAFLDALGARHPSWTGTVRERITAVAPDDDINYTLLALTVLEEKGLTFTRDDLRAAWLRNLAPGWTWGPERAFLTKASAATLAATDEEVPVGDARMEEWAAAQPTGVECCGALIRADAYGYACMGNPGLAAELAWRDAGMTHRRTGIYGAMFAAAAIAAAPVMAAASGDPLDVFDTALMFVPRGSRFHRVVSDCLSLVRAAPDWQSAYAEIHGRYARHGFCQVLQECGTLINTLRFARDTGEGICIQVMQGNDTDSFGATAGSLLGAWFGPEGLEPCWTAPFGNRILSTLAEFHEQDLSRVLDRVRLLPRLTLGGVEGQ
jgi:ADP-ribosylglycohydrolase